MEICTELILTDYNTCVVSMAAERMSEFHGPEPGGADLTIAGEMFNWLLIKHL